MENIDAYNKELVELVNSQKKKKLVNSIRLFIGNKLKDSTTTGKIQFLNQIENKYIQSVFRVGLIQTFKYPDDIELATELIKNCEYADVREVCIHHVRLELFIKHMDEYDRFHDISKEISVFKWGDKDNPEMLRFVLEYEIHNSIALSKEKFYCTIIEVPQMDLAEERTNEFTLELLNKEKERIRDYKSLFKNKEVNLKIKTQSLQPKNNSHENPFITSAFRKVIRLEREGVVISYPTGIEYWVDSTYKKKDYLKHEGVFYPCLNELQVLLLKELFEDSDERYKDYKKGIGKKLTKEIDSILKKEDESSFIKVDKKRMSRSLESWVYILIDYEKDDILGFGNTTGVLTW